MEANTEQEALRIQKRKVYKLGRVILRLLADEPVKTQDALATQGINDLTVFIRDASDSAEPPDAVWDANDNVYRCPHCTWELEGGICAGGCQLGFDIPLEDDADYTSNEAFSADRVSQPRGSTPLLDVGRCLPPGGYTPEKYEQLRQRGATRLMCETFHLEFHEDVGIVAWADGDIYEEFAGPVMQTGDFRKIMLGRRVELGDDDPDDSEFVEALLEDAIVFPLTSTCKWETVEESPGIWVTRAVGIALRSSSGDSGNESDTSTATENELFGEWERARGLQDEAMEPDYVAPLLPVAAQHYESSDAESDSEPDRDMAVDESIAEESDDALDSGWAYQANVPDAGWGEETVEGTLEGDDGDSADSDFDDEEVLSGDDLGVH
ncbi:hypothetical protein DFH07DRAFT_206331 [Mycena maculata]|uniref:DUF8191 domain-containing protein n=1 Tax=Mycena maculata TaxID=230809 RepID=A0AAD7P0X5_9AGAR|nr:hypothetical protein DFH07DRAFT_206331 [Mycena maculata]